MNEEFSVVGGARVGLWNATWPFARLSVTSRSLTLAVTFLGTFAFRPEDVVALEPTVAFPAIGRGVRIVHGKANCPAEIVFWLAGDPVALALRIRDAGFAPSCPESMTRVSARRVIHVVRSLAAVMVATTVVSRIVVSLLRRAGLPGVAVPLSLVLLAGAWLLPRSALLQRVFLVAGADVETIRRPLAQVQLAAAAFFALEVALRLLFHIVA